jgi:hypothetical protein
MILDMARKCSMLNKHLIRLFLHAIALVGISEVIAAPYELRVYSDDIPQKGESEIELIMSVTKPKLANEGPRGQVFQTLVEYGYGLGRGWSIGLELPMSHVDGRNQLNGVKIEAQYVAEHNARQGIYWGVRSDVGYTSSPYETQGSNSLDINPILGYRLSTWHIVVNPSFEIPMTGPNKKTQFQPSAKLANGISSTTQVGLEYFSNWGALFAVRPQHARDETLYLVWDEKLTNSRWNWGLGKPLNPSGGSIDKWVVKVGVALELD